MSRSGISVAKLVALSAALALGVATTAQAEVWRIATKMPAGSPEGKGFVKFGELVTKYTNGKIEVKVFPSEQLGKSEAVLEQVQAGTITVYTEGSAYLEKWVPEMGFASSSPFLFRSRDQWVRFMASDAVQGWLKKVEDVAGIAIIGKITDFQRGPYRVLITKKPFKGLADMQGLKMRQAPLDLLVKGWTYMGCEVRVLGWTEVYESISRGIVESVTSPMALVESMKFTEVAPHITRTDEYWQAVAFMVNAKAYRGLSPDLKAAVDKAFSEAAQYNNSLMETAAKESIARMTKKGVTYDEIDLNPIFEKAAGFYQKLEAEGKMPAGFLKLVKAAE